MRVITDMRESALTIWQLDAREKMDEKILMYCT